MKRSVLALSILAGSLLSGCSTLNGANDAVMNLVGPSTQSRVAGKYVENADVRQHYKLDVQQQSKQRLSYDGHAIPAHETRQNNLVDIPMLQNYLQGIVTRLSKGWPGEMPALQVRITDSYSFGPSADSVGNVFVPLGMLDNVESEDEIAAMLGHEMSHVLLRHHDRVAAFKEQKELMTNIATTVVFAAMASNTGVDRSSGTMKLISKDPLGTQKTIGNTVLYTALANSFSDNIWSTAWGRSQEDQADLLGTDLMIRAGYAPRAASYSLQRLNDFQGKQKPLLGSFLSERKTAMQQSLEHFNLNSFTKELDVLINQGLTTSITATSEYFNRSHMSPIDRDEELRQYLQREYRQERRARVDTRSWPKVRDAAPVVAATQAYKDAYAATAALEQGKLSEADALNQRALSSPVKDQPGIRRTAFAVHIAQGKSAEALKDLESIKDWSLAGPSIYDLMIGYHLKRGDAQSALAMIDKAERNLGSEELFITEKLLANQQLKNAAQVQAVLSKCEQYPTRKESCKKLAPVKA
ncbi:peptidase M48 [Pseudomonas fluorescens]|jgi:Zn-dependent protease with chaperone function|uniref:M48 family metallopeptidase n=1 Tax=Pseudomonas fluorescens TaxID=294 RepID=UPI00054BFC2D|nr:M48 family metallopeptidase [Pseudomonas fluorescens]KII32185.1 peptidase M48 [Pseudomonas fluorescens]